MKKVLDIIGRANPLFSEDVEINYNEIKGIVERSNFLVLGGAGSIGQAVVKEIFKRSPLKLHVVDISENNLVELVRCIRSDFGYISGEFRTFVLDIGSSEFSAFFEADGRYDFILNLSALKHVRSEKDPYTLMRMLQVNIFNTEKTLNLAIKKGVKKYFCVSTDKAANPVNMMGATKLVMEMFLSKYAEQIDVSTARFANVAFSDGSLLSGFKNRIENIQPIVAPNDIKRYFITQEEAGELCLISCLLGKNREIFFPKLTKEVALIGFEEIARRFLASIGYVPEICLSEDEARKRIDELVVCGKWPCLFQKSDTTGEKPYEEFFTEQESLDLTRFATVGIVNKEKDIDIDKLAWFKEEINKIRHNNSWSKSDIVHIFKRMIPGFRYKELGKFLDDKM